MNLTPTQQQAVAARGNVLLMAGAGTGKTHTLIERVHSLLTAEPPVGLDEILMVTFTDAAAAEMRERIAGRLKKELHAELKANNDRLAVASDEAERRPLEHANTLASIRWQEKSAQLETAHIGTLHSFCLFLVRQHFYELELDPQLTVLGTAEARLLAEETLEALFQKHYAGRAKTAEAVQKLIQAQARGSDRPLRTLMLRLHNYAQTRPDPEGWMAAQLALFANPAPDTWREWFTTAFAEWRTQWLPQLQAVSAGNQVVKGCAAALAALPANPTRAQTAAALANVTKAEADCPYGKKKYWVVPFSDFFEDAAFLSSLATEPTVEGADPLTEDWAWVREQMTTLLEMTREFTERFAAAKLELGMLDFNDLEQHALQLLWNRETGQPTEIALHWRRQFQFIFVDEYQDINAAQDKIIQALSRDGRQANRFLVGDVKQSIYRFRLAEPAIFRDYAERWSNGSGTVLPLTDNFRSRAGILDFVNSLFSLLMCREIGGIAYDEKARLLFAPRPTNSDRDTPPPPPPNVELLLRLNSKTSSAQSDDENSGAAGTPSEFEDSDKEARMMARRLCDLKEQGHPVWDEDAKQFRPVEWRDMAVLLRSAANRTDAFARAFTIEGVPLQVPHGGFFQCLEVSDLLSLLRVLDNPLQDLPLLAVLRSPLVGLSVDDLAQIRLTVPRARFWTTLTAWAREEGENTSTARAKVTTFLQQFAHWRRLARQTSLSRCLETVLAETHYATWLLTQPRGAQRHSNVQSFLALAQGFDQFQRQGLFRFLGFVDAQLEAGTEPEVPSVCDDNAVRLMTIHQSKGLEFPVVVVADLGRQFNLKDLRGQIILDEAYGLCPQIKPPQTEQQYPSLPYWLAARRQQRELLGEELRLLYVAMTRAKDTLLLSATLKKSTWEKRWTQKSETTTAALLAAANSADWLALWFAQNVTPNTATAGETPLLKWALVDETRPLASIPTRTADVPSAYTSGQPATVLSVSTSDRPADVPSAYTLLQPLNWQYPHTAATQHPAKTSVTALRQAALADDESVALPTLPGVAQASPPASAGSVSLPHPQTRPFPPHHPTTPDPVEIGNAQHAFLERVALDQTATKQTLLEQAALLKNLGTLTPTQVALLDFDTLAAFWNSVLGRKIRDNAPRVHRELAFTARFSPPELAALTSAPLEPALENEFVVVQGVADLVIIKPDQILLLDFKTDHVTGAQLQERANQYAPQLKLYAAALSRIYNRPVTESWLYFLSAKQAVNIGL